MQRCIQIFGVCVVLSLSMAQQTVFALNLCFTEACFDAQVLPANDVKEPRTTEVSRPVEEAIKQRLLDYSAAWMAADLPGVVDVFHSSMATQMGLTYAQWKQQIQYELPTNHDASMLFYEIQFLHDKQQRPDYYRTRVKRTRTSTNVNDYAHLEYEWYLSKQGQWLIAGESLVEDTLLLSAAKPVPEIPKQQHLKVEKPISTVIAASQVENELLLNATKRMLAARKQQYLQVEKPVQVSEPVKEAIPEYVSFVQQHTSPCQEDISSDMFGVQMMVVRSEAIALRAVQRLGEEAWIYISPNKQYVVVAGLYAQRSDAERYLEELHHQPNIPHDVFITQIKPERLSQALCFGD